MVQRDGWARGVCSGWRDAIHHRHGVSYSIVVETKRTVASFTDVRILLRPFFCAVTSGTVLSYLRMNPLAL